MEITWQLLHYLFNIGSIFLRYGLTPETFNLVKWNGEGGIKECKAMP